MIYLVACRHNTYFFGSTFTAGRTKKKYLLLLHHCRVGSVYFDQMKTYTVNTPSTTDVAAPSGPVRLY